MPEKTANPASVDADTAKKISQARIVNGRDYTDRMIHHKNFAELFAKQAEARASETYLIYRNNDTRVEFTYHEFFIEAVTLANFLKEELKVQAGDRISTLAYNHYRTVIVYYAALSLGAVVVPINIGDDDEQIAFIQSNSEVKICFVMPDLATRYNKIKSRVNTVEKVINMGSELDDFLGNGEKVKSKSSNNFTDYDLDQILSTKIKNPEEAIIKFSQDVDLDTEALIVYTSGTTGAPKGVVLQQYNILLDAHCISEYYNWDERDKLMIILPIHHVNGFVVTLLGALTCAGAAILNRKFSASNYWNVVSEEKASCGSVVPTILAFLCEKDKQVENTDPSKFAQQNIKTTHRDFFLICGAGPLTVELALRFEDTFPVKIVHGYGLSETTAYSCYMPLDYDDTEHRKWLSEYGYPAIGSALPCNEMAIHDEHGQDLPPGQKGEIVIKGHNVMKYYFQRLDANAETFKHGWFRSGDEGFYELDQKKRKQFFITGRLKELIIRGGINYSPLEIDEILNEVPGVKAAMAVGFENNAYGEEIGAYVVKEDEQLTEKQVIEYCKERLSYNKSPKVVIFGADFPVTATGKYKRNELKPLFIKYRDQQY